MDIQQINDECNNNEILNNTHLIKKENIFIQMTVQIFKR